MIRIMIIIKLNCNFCGGDSYGVNDDSEGDGDDKYIIERQCQQL